ncbi:hypothetical protein HZS55_15795 [Halosimplex rubrum]|uniref:Uncharacterized protein n=1 Tax=Halosimplex rubrum TaxID=869889 RepID=A0A7D5T401_9EURY|nr:hypothetical protein [Halosimplex rubrum]QLH75775.1 hypothetical protein HZS55_15795 [Halosimplex rubrum]
MSERRASFSDPDTHFQLMRSRSPVHVDGFKKGEPTGVVTCLSCWRSARNSDHICHRWDCPQKHARSRWYWRQH